MERVCVFIDGNNFYFGLKRNNRATRVDYYQLCSALVGPERKLVRSFYYNVAYDQKNFPEKAKIQQPFLDSLDRTPYLETRLGRMVLNHDKNSYHEKGVEVMLSSEMVFYAARNLYETAILVTEDDDYSPIMELVKQTGKHVEIALFPDIQPKELIHFADNRIDLDKVLTQHASKIFPVDTDDNRGNM